MFFEITKVAVAGPFGKKGAFLFLENILGFPVQQSCIGFEVLLSSSVSIGKHGHHSQSFVTDQLDERSLPMIQSVSKAGEFHFWLLRLQMTRGSNVML